MCLYVVKLLAEKQLKKKRNHHLAKTRVPEHMEDERSGELIL
jgi:hypothetical protein